MRLVWCSVVVLAACGRIGFDGSAEPAGDAPGADATDAPDAAPACAGYGPWGAEVALTTLNSPSRDYGPWLSPDGLRIYVDSDRGGDLAIYRSQRPTRGTAFQAPVLLAELASTAADTDATQTADELELFFTSNRVAASRCLFHARRATQGAAWGSVTRLDDLCTGYASGGSHISANGLRLYYNDDRDSFDQGVIFVATRPDRSSPFGAPVAVTGLDATNKGYPVLTDDELTMFYEQEVGGVLKLYEVTRTSVSAPFGTPVRPDGFPDRSDADAALTSDGLVMIYASDTGTSVDLFEVTRSCL